MRKAKKQKVARAYFATNKGIKVTKEYPEGQINDVIREIRQRDRDAVLLRVVKYSVTDKTEKA
jgi:hypothetical protein